jgi:hypothetical protein
VVKTRATLRRVGAKSLDGPVYRISQPHVAAVESTTRNLLNNTAQSHDLAVTETLGMTTGAFNSI